MHTNKCSLIASLFVSGFLFYSGAVFSASADGGVFIAPTEADEFRALNDVNNVTHDPATTSSTVTGNVTTNDAGAADTTLLSSVIGKYGSLALTNDGAYTYTLFNQDPSLLNLSYNESLTDSFTYQITNEDRLTAQAILTINIFGAAGATSTAEIQNVEIEPNNRSNLATPLNSKIDMKGHLQISSDKDWYSIQSDGNEIIHLELCPTGTSCFDEKGWVMYVFDGSKLTTTQEEATFTLRQYGDQSGVTYSTSTTNHMYINYQANVFDESLIGIIDPCYGDTTGLDIGVDNTPKTYYIAISSPLKGSGADPCGVGSSLILERDTGQDFTQTIFSGGNQTNVTDNVMEQFLEVAPNTDDQYQIMVTRTGTDPLKTDKVISSKLSGKTFTVPKLRVNDGVYSVEFEMQDTSDSSIKLNLSNYNLLQGADAGGSFLATYDEDANIVNVPKYLDEGTNKLYSLVFSYDPATEVLELIKYSPIE